jgi:3-keto-5-aminohexanoate cleavage enzyme
VAAALAMGGNVRVGLEDNFYLEQGKMAKSNGDLVEKACRLARDLGREVASTTEARAQLGLGTPSPLRGEGRGEGTKPV